MSLLPTMVFELAMRWSVGGLVKLSGFEGLQVESFGGRAWEEVETEPLEPCTIRVSASVWRLIERDASRQGMTVSAWTCQALTREVTQTLKAS